VTKFVARLLATAALDPNSSSIKWAPLAKEWPTHSSPPKNISKSKTKIQALDKKVLTNSV
jgi:hypothetical protein